MKGRGHAPCSWIAGGRQRRMITKGMISAHLLIYGRCRASREHAGALPERAGRAMSARGMKVFMMGAVVCRGELEGLRDLRLICRHVELSRLAAALFLFGGGVWWGSVGWCGCRVG